MSDIETLRQKERAAQREVQRLERDVHKASEARRLLSPGSSRARVTTANAKWARKCEARDRAIRVLAEATEAYERAKACRSSCTKRGAA
jgi:hypothetical protein